MSENISLKSRLFTAFTAVFLIAASPKASMETNSGKSKNWISLFNGQNLDGWTPKIKGYAFGDDPLGTFRVEDGNLRVSYENYETFDNRFGHIFYKSPFSSYRLKLEYRFLGEQVAGGEGWAVENSGIMLHSQDPATMTKDQDFPVSIEVQFLGAAGQKSRPTGNLCTPGTHVVMDGELFTPHCVSSTSPTIPKSDWVSLEVEVHGNGTIKHIVNGDVVLKYEKAQLDPSDPYAQKIMKNDLMLKSGYISLQSESHEIEFKNIMILPLEE